MHVQSSWEKGMSPYIKFCMRKKLYQTKTNNIRYIKTAVLECILGVYNIAICFMYPNIVYEFKVSKKVFVCRYRRIQHEDIGTKKQSLNILILSI